MGKEKKIKKLLECDDVFVDAWNNLYFGGHEVLQENELVAMPTVAYAHDAGGELRERNRDIRKRCKVFGGEYEMIFTIESQTGIDNTMPLRIMGYEYAAYEEQVDRIVDKNKQVDRDAGSRRIFSNQKVKPEMTGVLYFGDIKWKRPVCLQDMTDLSDAMPEMVMSKIRDYPMNLIQMAYLTEEERGRLKSDLRLVAEYLACKNDLGKWERYIAQDSHKIRHVAALLDLLGEISKDKRFYDLLAKIQNDKREEEEWHMCKIIDEYERRGMEKGMEMAMYVVKCIQDNVKNGRGREVVLNEIVDTYKIPYDKASEYYNLVTGN